MQLTCGRAAISADLLFYGLCCVILKIWVGTLAHEKFSQSKVYFHSMFFLCSVRTPGVHTRGFWLIGLPKHRSMRVPGDFQYDYESSHHLSRILMPGTSPY